MATIGVIGVDGQHVWVREGPDDPPRYITFAPAVDGRTIIMTDLGGQERQVPLGVEPYGTAALVVDEAERLHALVRELGGDDPRVLESARAFARRVVDYLDRRDA